MIVKHSGQILQHFLTGTSQETDNFPTETNPLSLSFCRRVLGGQPAAEPQPEARHPPRRQRQLVLHRLHTTLAGTARRSDMVFVHMNCSLISKFIKKLDKISGVDSRVWAKGLSWNRQLPDGNWEKLDLDRKARYNRDESSTYRVTHQDG